MKILNSIIKFGKAFDALTMVGKYAAFGAMIFIAFSFGNCKGEDKYEQFKIEYTQYKKSAETAVKYGDSLRKEVNKLDDKIQEKDVLITSLTVTIGSKNKEQRILKNKLSDLEQDVDSLKKGNDSSAIIVAQDEVIENLKSQVETAESIIVKKDSIISLQQNKLELTETQKKLYKMESDSLRTVIQKMPKAPTNPNKIWGIIPKPSRTVIGVTAFATGVIVGTQLKR